MVRFLPFILIPLLILGSLWYWRNLSSRQIQSTPQAGKDIQAGAVEVPKTLPDASTEDKVKILEEVVTKLAARLNSIKSAQTQTDSSSDNSEISDLKAQLTELKVRVSTLEKATPQPAGAGTKYPLYIPLGSGGGPWGNQDWSTLTEYQAVINPDSYSGYTGMQLEVNFRMIEAAGTASVRLYNVTDNSSISSQVDTTSTSFGLKTSGTFKLPGGQKTYTIQIKTSEGKDLFVQSARIKVNF